MFLGSFSKKVVRLPLQAALNTRTNQTFAQQEWHKTFTGGYSTALGNHT